MDLNRDVKDYYTKGLEQNRLKDELGNLELIRTLDILQRNLPQPPAIILDIGGAAGVYAFELASKGYQVHLVDPVELHIEQATKINTTISHPLEEIILGDARKLTYNDEFADVILFFGPLYHLTTKKERIKALNEAYRVLRPNGLLFAVGISRFASLLDGVDSKFILDTNFIPIIKQDLTDGQHRNPVNKDQYFTTAFFHHPFELKEEIQEAKFRSVNLLFVEGPFVLMKNTFELLKMPEQRELLLTFMRHVEKEPTLLGAGGHIMAIGKK